MENKNTVSEMLSLKELCGELSVSLATGKNWVRLGKIAPSENIGGIPYFTRSYTEEIKKSIKSGENKALKSRRNKKYISGNGIYNSYISEGSQNISQIRKIFSYISGKGSAFSENIMCAVLAECSLQLILKKNGISETSNSLEKYLRGGLAESNFFFLVKDLMNCFSVDLNNIPAEISGLDFAYEPTEDILGLLYISLNNLGSRKAAGAYYTPVKTVRKVCEMLFSGADAADKYILDPCCGSGNFILQLPPDIQYTKVYGGDTDKISVMLARINFALKYDISDSEIIYSHIEEKNYLLSEKEEKFDIIMGNPPWGCGFLEEEKAILRKKYRSVIGSQTESYDVFVEKAVGDLKAEGVFAFVLPEAILNVKNHTPIREILLRETAIKHIEFLGNVFDKVQCPAIILNAKLDGSPPKTTGIKISEPKREYTIKKERRISAEWLNMAMTDSEYDILEKMDNIPNKAILKNNAFFALGIVTGNNKKYISAERKENSEPLLKGSDIFKFRYRTPNSYITFTPENFQQTAPEKYYRTAEKLFYRFIGGKLVFAYDDRGLLSLNSCNILIPNIPNLGIKYVAAVLNSGLVQFYFQKKFRSVKILRSHIEQIPIPVIGKTAQDEITERVDLILNTENEKTASKVCEEIDLILSALYGLSLEEYKVASNVRNYK